MRKITLLFTCLIPLLINAQNNWKDLLIKNQVKKISIYSCEYKFGEPEKEGVLKSDTLYDQKGNPEIINSTSMLNKTFYYDENNNVIKITSTFSSKEKILSVFKNSYDEKKRLIEYSEYHGEGTFLKKYSFKFDDQNNLIEKKITSSFGENIFSYKYKFDNNKRPIETSISDNGALPEVTIYKYNYQGLPIEKTINPTGMYKKTIYTYNGSGLLSDEIATQISNGTITNGKVIGDPVLQHKYKFNYDDKKLVIEKIIFNTYTKEPEQLMRYKYEFY